MTSWCNYCGMRTRGINFCHNCKKDKPKPKKDFNSEKEFKKGFDDILKGNVISEKEFKKKHSDKIIKIEIMESDIPQWIGLIKIFFKTNENEWECLHIGSLNKECFNKLKNVLDMNKKRKDIYEKELRV